MKTAAVIVAAGRGARAGLEIPKQYRSLCGAAVLTRALRPFLAHPRIDAILCVIHPDDLALYEKAIAACPPRKLLPPAFGADTRQASVRAGLESLPASGVDLVLIHDGARPFASAGLIDRAVAAAATHSAAIPALAVTDTVVRAEGGVLQGVVPRSELRSVQTPQSFRLDLIRDAHRLMALSGRDFTDDGGVAAACGHAVHIFEGDALNIKLTTADDFLRAEAMIEGRLVTRVATGYDVHAFGAGDRIWLGGVAIPYEAGLVGHSDADVLLHAMTDAVLGVLGDGDIGSHFPPSDAQWRGASSDRFLSFATTRLRERGGLLDHLDGTIICEAPRIGPHREAMRVRIAEICALPVASVSVKATTSERLGFTGRREGVAAHATATVRLPA